MNFEVLLCAIAWKFLDLLMFNAPLSRELKLYIYIMSYIYIYITRGLKRSTGHEKNLMPSASL